ncbi:MAG: hypothetical protein ING89_06405 [Rubrivivax sp.]|jgi:hypothetical protein|nr:hypothetical protein [Rubrivivax sp.]
MQAEPTATRRFALEVQPQGLLRPWHAWLHDDRGDTVEFDAPLDLLRHLLSLNEAEPPAAGLR